MRVIWQSAEVAEYLFAFGKKIKAATCSYPGLSPDIMENFKDRVVRQTMTVPVVMSEETGNAPALGKDV